MKSSWQCGAVALAVVLGGSACGGDPLDVSGDYTVSLTNRENGCMFDNWTEGDSSQNIPVTVEQDGADTTATVGGAAALFLDLALGSHVYEGKVSGDNLDLTLFGTRSQTQGNCAYTVNSRITATVSDDFLQGNLRYTTSTNGSPDCGDLEGCQSRQELNGNRPPAP